MQPAQIVEWIAIAKGGVDALRGALALMPAGAARDELQHRVDQADLSLQKAEVFLAKDLEYKLCRCTFPPQIMLWKNDIKTNVCGNCGSQNPRIFAEEPDEPQLWERDRI